MSTDEEKYKKEHGKGRGFDCKSELMQEYFDCMDEPQ